MAGRFLWKKNYPEDHHSPAFQSNVFSFIGRSLGHSQFKIWILSKKVVQSYFLSDLLKSFPLRIWLVTKIFNFFIGYQDLQVIVGCQMHFCVNFDTTKVLISPFWQKPICVIAVTRFISKFESMLCSEYRVQIWIFSHHVTDNTYTEARDYGFSNP